MSVLTQIRNWFNLGTEETEDVGLDALTDELSLGDIEVYESLGDIEVYESLGVDDYDGENIAEAPDEDCPVLSFYSSEFPASDSSISTPPMSSRICPTDLGPNP